MQKYSRLVLLGLLLLLLTSAAFAGDFRIVPGQRIGTVVLGMDRTSVHTLLHTPSTTRRLHGGLIVDTWLSHQMLPPAATQRGNYLKRDYLTVFFRHGHAVQIEVSSPQFKTASGLGTKSSVHAFAAQYPTSRTPRFAADPALNWGDFHYNEAAVDPDGSSPVAKHFVFYGDATVQGIAWKYGAWGDLAPEPDTGRQEAVIVHTPGRTVLLNPNDGLPYAGTGPARKSLDN